MAEKFIDLGTRESYHLSGPGDHVLSGQAGLHDVFVLKPPFGNYKITNFDANEDVIYLPDGYWYQGKGGNDFWNFAQLIDPTSADGLIPVGGTLTIEGTPADLLKPGGEGGTISFGSPRSYSQFGHAQPNDLPLPDWITEARAELVPPATSAEGEPQLVPLVPPSFAEIGDVSIWLINGHFIDELGRDWGVTTEERDRIDQAAAAEGHPPPSEEDILYSTEEGQWLLAAIKGEPQLVPLVPPQTPQTQAVPPPEEDLDVASRPENLSPPPDVPELVLPPEEDLDASRPEGLPPPLPSTEEPAPEPGNVQILPGAPPTGSAPEPVGVALKDLPAPPPVPAPPSAPPSFTEESAPEPPASDTVQDLGGPSGDDTTEDEELTFTDLPPPPDVPPPPSFSPDEVQDLDGDEPSSPDRELAEDAASEPDARSEAPSSDTVQDLGGNEPTIPNMELSSLPMPEDDMFLV